MSKPFENFVGSEGEIEQVVGSIEKIKLFPSQELLTGESTSMTAMGREPITKTGPERTTSRFDRDQIIGLSAGGLLTLAGLVGISIAFIVTLGLPVIPIIGIVMPVISAKLFGALLAGSLISAGIGILTLVFNIFR